MLMLTMLMMIIRVLDILYDVCMIIISKYYLTNMTSPLFLSKLEESNVPEKKNNLY